MKHTFTEPDLIELDKIWPLGQQLEVPEGGNIVIAGAYEGRYMRYLGEMFPSALVVGYEPQSTPFNKIFSMCLMSTRSRGVNVALGTGRREVSIITSDKDGATLITNRREVETVTMVDAVETLPAPTDLLLLNMEGYEWVLIPYLLNNLMHHRIASMAIQFHADYCSDQHENRVLSQLSEYYNKTYQDENNWTHWRRK